VCAALWTKSLEDSLFSSVAIYNFVFNDNARVLFFFFGGFLRASAVDAIPVSLITGLKMLSCLGVEVSTDSSWNRRMPFTRGSLIVIYR
jgi:hypothetical protein